MNKQPVALTKYTAITNLVLVMVFVSLTLVTNQGCERGKTPRVAAPSKEPNLAEVALISDLINSEDLILDLTPRLSRLADWYEQRSQNPKLPLSPELLSCVSVTGLAAVNSEQVFHQDSNHADFIEVGHWPLAETVVASAIDPWQPVMALDAQWETMKFGAVAGSFSDIDNKVFVLNTKVEARGHSPSTDSKWLYGLKAYQSLEFHQEAGQWVLKKWDQEDFYIERSQQPLFEEVLADVLKDPLALANAQRSFLDEIILKTAQTGVYDLPDNKYSKWTTMTSDHVYPSVSVVDFNDDGWDDIFLTARWGPTQMLKNLGDGTFVDVAEAVGLKVDFLVNCVLFVDLDNDGDKDLLMGHSLEPARYFQNNEGVFKDVTNTLSDLGEDLQYFTSGIAAADVNRDGLVDVYMSSYPPLNKKDTAFEHHFLSEKERKIYLEKRDASEKWVGTAGTANVLLMNRGGGRLERVPFDDVVSQWRRSYQPVWSDIDNDGDDDLYVCNDFAPDALLRNDTPRGSSQPVFVEITESAMVNKGVGFGMGASFGDFDADGDLDLYVSNMFSKAGRRIVKKLDSVDPRIQVAAAGCFLFVNSDGKFEQRAGSADDQFHVNQVGWSYGGQWADFDNDGRLDLYVPTGFYTAPREIDTEVDL